MIRTYNFLAPSLYPNTLVDISIPEPGPSNLDPVVKNLPIKHGEHNAIGGVKRMTDTQDGQIVLADDLFNISVLSLDQPEDDGPLVPTIVAQQKVAHRAGDVWSGLVPVRNGTISGLSSGLLTLHPSSSSSAASSSRTVPSPLLTLSSAGHEATDFALAGKEVDVSLWDVERTFAATSTSDPSSANGKRKKNELEQGEVWRAKNMPNNSLALRPPNHHLCLAHLSLKGPGHLASGTKSGTIRTYDVRQRKPTQEWKVAREGGVGSIIQGHSEHEVYFSDRANLLGAVDLRTGRLIHSYPNQTCTAHHLLTVPLDSESKSHIGLSSIASDAGLRLHSILPPKKDGQKGNVGGGGGQKAKVESMVGGVGIGNFLWRGHGTISAPVAKKEDKLGEDGNESEDDEDEEDDEEVWEGMSEVEDEGSDSESEEEEEVVAPRKKSKK